MEEKIKTVMSEILGIEVADILPETSPDNVIDWDSLRHMQLILALEEDLDIEIPDEMIEKMLSFADILRAIKQIKVD